MSASLRHTSGATWANVVTRAAPNFTAWTTYTDGHLIGVDQNVTQEYMSCLQVFSHMGRVDGEDSEVRNRTRLVGLATLTGVVTSEALYHSPTQFKAQVTTLIPALVVPLLEVEVLSLDHEAAEVKEQPNSPYLDEFRNRPAMERRALSIHLHVTGETGPTSRDVANASLRALATLFGHSNGPQAAVSMRAAFDCLHAINAWERPDHCRWVAIRAAEWTQYQYRYAIPTKLVECLVQEQDAPQSTPQHMRLAEMITSVFTSPTPLVNLSTSDIISNLISVILRRIAREPDDMLLPALVQSISSLGIHVYYSDQIQDLAGELISRLVVVETSGIVTRGKSDLGKGRTQAVRCLLAGLFGLMHAAETYDGDKDEDDNKGAHKAGASVTIPDPPSSPHPDAHVRPSYSDGHIKPSRRTSITPEVFQETLTLICDGDYAVRVDYATTIVSYLQREIPKLGDYTDADGVKRVRPVAEGPTQQASMNLTMVYGDSTTRFLHALHAHLYVLATSSTLGLAPSTSSPSPQRSVNEEASTTGTDDNVPQEQQEPTEEPRRRSLAIPRSRKMSVMKRLLRGTLTGTSLSSIPATLSDYGNILVVLQAVHEHLPIRGLLTGVPMLLALDAAIQGDAACESAGEQRVQAIREALARTWLVIGKVWDSPEVTQLVEKALSSSPASPLPPLSDVEPGRFHPAREPISFDATNVDAEKVHQLDSQGLLMAITSNKTVQDATGMDRQGLLRKFTAPWSAESAFKDSTEAQSPSSDLRTSDGLSPLVKVSPALMHIENLSRASLARSTRGVGVTDLREALEGRSSLSNTNLANTAASLSTLDHPSTVHGEAYKLAPVRSRPQQRSKLAGPADVKDVLNKLGIGKTNGNGMLKPSFSSKKPEQR
ncbi:hypothetical protein PHLCEN_2v3871 [Hermanssonia centrifuga]|uniref:Protein EFR3 n=1 Tax=Hermanssonia centrifuga TaxID=98765 RepID=A0A2R6QB70_9APHY|nr:hypothetical protein PHLCEN_2v3871 [Hermanssonia centrifuga]